MHKKSNITSQPITFLLKTQNFSPSCKSIHKNLISFYININVKQKYSRKIEYDYNQFSLKKENYN